MIRQRKTPRRLLIIVSWLAALALAGCGQVTAAPTDIPATIAPALPTVEVEVTRVVYRETLVTPTPAPAAPCAPEDLASADELVIGALLPQTTPGAWMRAANMQAGLSLALERLNSNGRPGAATHLAIYDTGDDPARSAQIAERLITEECAVALISGLGDAATRAVMEVAERFRKPLLVIDASDPALMAGLPQATFRLAPTQAMYGAMPANWLAEVGDYNGDGAVQAVVIAENSPVGDAFVEQSSPWFAAAGIDLAVNRVDLPISDFSPVIARLLAMPVIPDAVFLVIGADGGSNLQMQLFDAGIRPEKGTLIVNQHRRALDAFVDSQRVPPGAGTILARRGPWPTMATEAGRTLIDRFRQNALPWPELSTFLAYDAVLLLDDAVQRAPSLRGDDLIQALQASDIELAAGRYRFPVGAQPPPDGASVSPAEWHQWLTPPLLYLLVAQDGQDPATLDVIWPEGYRTVAGPPPFTTLP